MAKVNLSYEILTKDFSDKVSKQAYMKCIKWLALHVYNKPQIAEGVSVNITKAKAKIPTFRLVVYLDIDRKRIKEEFCQRCKVIHSNFYSVDKINCSECKMGAYIRNNNKYSEGLKRIYKEIIENEGSNKKHDN